MHKNLFLLISGLLLIPQLTLAQTVQKLFTNVPTFIDAVLIPFLFGMAFLVFVINVIRYFVIGGSNEKERDNAKNLAIYSVGAFVFLIIFWGVVNMFSDFLGLGGQAAPCSDFLKTFKECPKI